MRIPDELAFLEEVFLDPREKYSRADWLLSDFPAHVWKYRFYQKKILELDWDVPLADGSSLLDSQHENLLNGFKHWLIICTRPISQSAASSSLTYQSLKFGYALGIFDYLLLNAEQFGLLDHGLAGLHSDDLKALLDKIAESNDSQGTLSDWNSRLSSFLLSELEKADQAVIEETLIDRPELSIITPEQEDENRLGVALDQIPKVRALLFVKGFYVRNSGNYKMSVNGKKLSGVILQSTLRARDIQKPKFIILNVPNNGAGTREYPAVPVRGNDDEKIHPGAFRKYHQILYAMGELITLNLPAPGVGDFLEIADHSPRTSTEGRFHTLPSSVVFSAVRNAMEFHYEYSDALLNSYCRLAGFAVEKEIKLRDIPNEDFHRLLDPKLIELGVSRLGLSIKQKGWLQNENDKIKGDHDEYFTRLRNNECLLELIAVYYGAALTTIGATMARRQGELNDLVAGQCLDKTKRWLLFENRKSTSGVYGLRETEPRPIDQAVVEIVERLEKFQEKLQKLGALDELTNLFASPNMTGALSLRSIGSASTADVIDLFCDYFETSLNEKGERYYHRQHQLRRFFAMLFFYSSSFGGLETLQWFLCHTDRQHVWHYISESTNGAVLRGAKAQYIVEQLYDGNKNYEELANLIQARFGTYDFMIVDRQDAEDYVITLQEEGCIEIEPEFFEDEEGEQMEIMIHIKDLPCTA